MEHQLLAKLQMGYQKAGNVQADQETAAVCPMKQYQLLRSPQNADWRNFDVVYSPP